MASLLDSSTPSRRDPFDEEPFVRPFEFPPVSTANGPPPPRPDRVRPAVIPQSVRRSQRLSHQIPSQSHQIPPQRGNASTDHEIKKPIKTTRKRHRNLEADDEDEEKKKKDQAGAATSVFPLMRLPAELRLHIYRCALVRPYPIVLHKEPPPKPVKQFKASAKAPAPPAPEDASESDRVWSGDDSPPSIQYVPRRQPFAGPVRPAAVPLTMHEIWMHENDPEAWRATTEPAPRAHSVVHHPQPRAAPVQEEVPREPRPQDEDPLNAALLSASHTIYKEARQVLYGENTFALRFGSAIPSIGSLHQRSRSMIRHVHLVIPCPSDILDEFAEIVRLSLRYCWGLKSFTIILPFRLTGGEADSRTALSNLSTMHMYASAFNILRWLPKDTEVMVEGEICDEIRDTIAQNARLAKVLDAVSDRPVLYVHVIKLIY